MQRGKWNTRVSLRLAQEADYDYCAALYFVEMGRFLQQMRLNLPRHVAGFRQQWDPAEVRIITLDGADIGWLQHRVQDDALFLCQIIVDASFQRQGIGTEIINRLIDEASRNRQAVSLAVIKTNPAFRLYERLGFRITDTDDHKFYMKREPGPVKGPIG